MSSAALDRLLAVLLAALAITGIVSLWFGSPDGTWLFVVHALLAGTLATAVVLKLRRSLPRAIGARRWRPLVIAALVTVVSIASLAAGYAWAAAGAPIWVGVGPIGSWTLLTLHAWLGIVLLPVVVVHLLPRRWRLLRPGRDAMRRSTGKLLSRRALLAGGGLAVASIGAYGTAAIVDRLRGGDRRFTGSRTLTDGGIPISTTFFGEPAPSIDPAAWRLTVRGGTTAGEFTLDELRAMEPAESTAVLDCTSGWALSTTWRGVPISTVLAAAGIGTVRRVEVRSLTGWSTSLDASELDRCLLAWSVAGQPLPLANGAPIRLVAPDRRGLEWVKWVGEIRAA
ncbi:MAG: molybdopterin-dependent oxidoreductase [Chloroflexota bacterium]